MRILMLAPQPFFELRGTPISVLGRLRALTMLGHQVDLVTYHVGQSVSIPGVVIHRTLRIPFINSVKMGPSLIKLLLDSLLLLKAIQLLTKNRYDLLHSHEEASFFGVFLASMFNLPHLYDMHSSLPQQLGNYGYGRFFPLIRLFEWLEHRAILRSKAIITICPELEKHAKSISSQVRGVMIENIMSGHHPEAVTEEMTCRFRATHDLDGKKIVFYAGSFEPYQGIGLLVESAEQVIRREKNVLFVLMGGTEEQKSRYQTRVEKLGLSEYFRFLGKRPFEEVAQGTIVADVLISLRVNGTNTPLKIYDYLRSGKAIVATNLDTHTQVLNSSAAVLVEPNADAVAKGLLSVLEDPEFGKRVGDSARQLFESHYQFQTFIQKTDEAMQLALR